MVTEAETMGATCSVFPAAMNIEGVMARVGEALRRALREGGALDEYAEFEIEYVPEYYDPSTRTTYPEHFEIVGMAPKAEK